MIARVILVPSLVHEAPLAVFRNAPALVPALLRAALALDLPPFTTDELADADFTQPLPAEFRADLVIRLIGAPPARPDVLGIVVEVQRARDDDKRRSWPLYVAALHARLRCPTCLVVLATDPAVAAWAATPITSLQPGTSFVPLVLGPDHVPRVDAERARREPWLAVLSALAHGNRPDGVAVALTAIAAARTLDDEHANFCFKLIYASLNDATRRALEDEMLTSKDLEWEMPILRRAFDEGLEKGREKGREEGREDALAEARIQGLQRTRRTLLDLASRRRPELSADARQRVEACNDDDRLALLVVEVGSAPDADAVERLLAAL